MIVTFDDGLPVASAAAGLPALELAPAAGVLAAAAGVLAAVEGAVDDEVVDGDFELDEHAVAARAARTASGIRRFKVRPLGVVERKCAGRTANCNCKRASVRAQP
ncbi:MAG TPA: hypothetical protein VFG00_00725 [Acidothermaceae bacterium]|nr:hypothetical protein [Acidothermaceae bacterium]